jgi:hypothetical protein
MLGLKDTAQELSKADALCTSIGCSCKRVLDHSCAPETTCSLPLAVGLTAGLLAGLDPLLEAVAQLPADGQPIPSSLTAQVEAFLKQQCSQYVDAAASNAGSHPTLIHLEDGQTIQQLHSQLLTVADSMFPVPHALAKACACAAMQLVTDAADMVGQSIQAQTLLDQCFRAGALTKLTRLAQLSGPAFDLLSCHNGCQSVTCLWHGPS